MSRLNVSDDTSIPAGATELGRGAWIRPERLRFAYSRSSGPGGQSVNKLNTRAELRVAVEDIQGLSQAAVNRLRKAAGSRLTNDDELLLASEASRSQRENRERCFDRFRSMVLKAATPPKKRKKTKPSPAARERRLKAKREQSEKKQRRQRDRRPDER